MDREHYKAAKELWSIQKSSANPKLTQSWEVHFTMKSLLKDLQKWDVGICFAHLSTFLYVREGVYLLKNGLIA